MLAPTRMLLDLQKRNHVSPQHCVSAGSGMSANCTTTIMLIDSIEFINAIEMRCMWSIYLSVYRFK